MPMACGGGERSCRGRGGVSRGAGESEEVGFEEGCCSHAPAACAAARGGGRCRGDGLTMASNAVHVRDDMSTSSTRGEPAWAPRPLCEDGLRRRSACGHPMPELWSCGGAPKMARKALALRCPRWVLQEGAAPAARSASQALQTEVARAGCVWGGASRGPPPRRENRDRFSCCRRLPSELSRRPPGSRGRFRACSGPEMAEHVCGGMRGKPRGPATGHTPRVWSTPPQKQSPPWSTEEVLSPPCAPAAIAHPGPCARRMGMCDGCGAQCHVSLACVPSIVVGCSVDPPRPGRRTWPSI